MNTEIWSKLKIPYYNTEIIPLENQRGKLFKGFNRNIKVYCYLSIHGNFTISAGPNSDFSYSGSFYPQTFNTIEQICKAIDEKYKQKKLIK